jgi:hypothetical protein
MNQHKSGDWTRRQLLRRAPALMAPALVSPGALARSLSGKSGSAPPLAPFSKFTDVTKALGLQSRCHMAARPM